MSDGAKPSSELKLIPIDDIVPNSYNPNRMPNEAFQEYMTEVEHLGRLPKPIVVRRREDGKAEIIDGEHGWRAAKQLGFEQVLCEVLADVDDFEAMRQCYKRNRGGEDNNVILGRMFLEMQKKGKLSTRKLANKIKVPETTIRAKQRYARVADDRSKYAGEDRTDEVARLTNKQVELYVHLPAKLANIWLDSGGDIKHIQPKSNGYPYAISETLQKADLLDILESGYVEFPRSLRYAMELAEWSSRHQLLPEVKEYVKLVGKRHLPVEVLDCLPIRGPSND